MRRTHAAHALLHQPLVSARRSSSPASCVELDDVARGQRKRPPRRRPAGSSRQRSRLRLRLLGRCGQSLFETRSLEQRAERLGLEQLAPDARPSSSSSAKIGRASGVQAPSPARHSSASAGAQLVVAVGRVEEAADHELRRDRAVPAVLLQPEGDVVADRAPERGRAARRARTRSRSRRRGRAGGRGSAGACPRRRAPAATARTPARAASPPGCRARTARAARARCARSSVSARAGDDRVDPRHRHEVVVGERGVGVRGERLRRTPRAARARSRARRRRGGRRSAEVRGARGERAVEVERRGSSGRSPSSRRSAVPAISTTGRLKRSTRRDATIPITPSCQSSPQRRSRGGGASPRATTRPRRRPRAGSAPRPPAGRGSAPRARRRAASPPPRPR